MKNMSINILIVVNRIFIFELIFIYGLEPQLAGWRRQHKQRDIVK